VLLPHFHFSSEHISAVKTEWMRRRDRDRLGHGTIRGLQSPPNDVACWCKSHLNPVIVTSPQPHDWNQTAGPVAEHLRRCIKATTECDYPVGGQQTTDVLVVDTTIFM
jgi:hypothetical protein